MLQFFSLLSCRLFTAQHVSGVFPSIIKSSMTAVSAYGFTFVSWRQLCCVRNRKRRSNTANTKPNPELHHSTSHLQNLLLYYGYDIL
jgi:hypothetical protein